MATSHPEQKANAAKLRSRTGNSEPLICERWMTTRVHTAKPLDSVAHARSVLEEHRINQLPIVTDGVLVGIVTDRDLRDAVSTAAMSAKEAHTTEPVPQTAAEIPLKVVMSGNPIALAPSSTLLNAAVLMRRARIGSVPIVDGHRLVGILTRSDILDAFVARENGRRQAERLSSSKATAKS